MTSVRTLTLRHLCVAPVIWLLTLLGSGSAHAQLDTRHWLPPLWSVIGNDAGVIDDHWLFVSTPEVSPVDFTIKDGAGNTYTGTVSNSAPVALQIGNLGTTFGPYTAGGWAGTHTAQLVYGTNNLNTSLPDGLVVESVRPVYVSIRQKSGSQGEILASPGRKGLGKEFRALFARDVLSTNTWRGTFISVMATEPGTTTITFDGIKPGIKLFGRADANNDGTTDAFSVTLSQNQSYIVGIQDTSYTGTAPIADLNGTRVTSDKLVAVTSGFFLGGPTPTSGQDAGFDQLVPTDLAGTEYVMIKGNALASSALETVTVVATQDNTNIFTKGSSTPLNPTPLNAGDYYWVNNEYVGDGLYLTASKPVLVCQGIGGSDSLATSGANVIPPLGADASNFVNNIPLVNFYGTATVGIVTRTGASVTINGSAPSVSAQPIYGTPDWVTYKITGLTGTVDVESNSAVAVSLINVSGVAGLAGYFSGFPSSKTVDLDNDNTVDGGDNCPDDPNQDQIDDDGDGVGNRCDQCDDDPLKAIPGVCGCGVPDGDFDGDGVVCSDNCPFIANASQTDSDNDGIGDACANDLDNDGTPNAQDGCPTDRRKVAPGQCGCGFAETDSDLDGAANCVDECPLDPNKAAAGACGCGQLETDTDGDSIPDCIDLCGNSHLDAGEACDDGNVFNTDACTTQCQARPVAAADTAIAVEDGSVVIDVQANDPTALVRAVGTVIASAPSHGTAVVGVDGRVTYTPTAHYHGADSFTYKLADDVSQSDAVTVGVTINQSLFAPVAVADAVALAEGDTATTLVGGATSVLANDSDANAGDTLTAVLVTGVAHGDLVLNSDGSFSYHHDGSETTSDGFSYKVSDGALFSGVVSVTIAVTPSNDAPVAVADAVATAEGGTATTLVGGATSVLANDTDPDSSPIAVLVASAAHGTLVLNSDGTFSYHHDGSETTSDSFTYRAFDGLALSGIVTVSIAVSPVDDAPVAVADSVQASEGGSVSALVGGATSVLANDSDAEGATLSAQLVSGPAYGSLTLNGDGTFSYTHDGSETTSDSFSYRVSDGGLTSGVVTVSIAVTPVNDAPTAGDDAIDVAEGGTATTLVGGALSLLANDSDVDSAMSAVLVSGPAHGALTLRADGTFSYVHDGSETTSDSFSYRAFDGVASSSVVTVAIAVTPVNDAPVAVADAISLAEGGSVSTLVGGATSLIANDSDAEGSTLTAMLVSGPAHGSLTLNANGTFSYSHDGSEGSSDAFSYKVSDGARTSSPVSVSIAVTPVNDAPVAVADLASVAEGGTVTTLVGGATSVMANDSDPDGPTLFAILVASPSHGTLTLNSNGTFRYVHDGSETTSDAFSYRLSDGDKSSATVSVTFAVTPVNDAPVAVADAVAVAEGGTVSTLVGGATSLLANDSDAEGQTLTAILVSGPTRGSLTLNANGTFSYTHDGSETTSDSFSYKVSDGSAQSAAVTVTFAVTPVNDAPVAVADAVQVAEGGTVATLVGGATSLLANDHDVDGPALTAVLVSGPAHGALTLNANGTFSYVHDGSETTSDSFSYQASDGSAQSAAVTVTLAISPVNDAPVAVADALAVAEGQSATRLVGGASSLLANDQDAEGQSLTAVLVADPAHGTLVLNADGTFVYTHDGSETTSDSFSYKASDGARASAVVTVSIAVSATNDAPVAGADAVAVAEGGTVTTLIGGASSVLANDQDADGQSLTALLVSGPAHGALTLNADGSFAYTHDGSETSADSFSYRAFDGLASSSVVTIAIAVAPVNDAPVAGADAITVAEGGSVATTVGGASSLVANDGDAEGQALSAILVSGPAHGALTLNADGSFLYTHDGSETTADSFSYRVSDGELTSGAITVAIAITPVDDAPVAGADALSVAEGGTVTTLVGGETSLLANDGDVDAESLVAILVSGPAHGALTLNPDGTFAYTHDGSETSADSFSYQSNDGFLSSEPITVSIAITPVNDAPVAGADALSVAEGDTATTLVGGAISLLADDSDAEGQALTAVLLRGPAHGELVLNADGSFRYTHDGSETTDDDFVYAAGDGVSQSAPTTVVIAVTPVDDAPVAVADRIAVMEGGSATTTTDGSTSLVANDTDAERDTLTVTLVSGPAHGALVLNADGSFRYTHDGSETSEDSFAYQSHDASRASAVMTVVIAIVSVNNAPVAVADSLVVAEGGTATTLADEATSVLANDSDAEGDPLTALLVSGPAHGTLTLRADGTFAYVHDGSETLVDSFSYRAYDGVAASELVTLAIVVTPVDDAPVAGADHLSVREGESVTTVDGGASSLLENDSDAEGDTLSVTLVRGPDHGVLVLSADGTFRYTHDGSEARDDSFDVQVSDGRETAPVMTVAIAIAPANDAPIAAADQLGVAEGQSATALDGDAGSVLANDSDPDGDAFAAVLVSGPAHGSLTLNADGSFRYTHDGSETSADSFSYAARDGVATSAPVTVSIVVTPVNDAPVAGADAIAVVEGKSTKVLVGGATSVLDDDGDAEGQALSAVLVAAPAHGAFTLYPNGSFSYTHDGSETSEDSFAYRASDGDASSDVVIVPIHISAVDDAPVAFAASLTVAEGGTATTLDDDSSSVLASATDAEGDALTAVIVSGPTHGSLVLGADGRLSYTHDGSQATSDSFSFQAFDGQVASEPVVVTIHVTPANDAPVAAADSVSVDEAGSATTLVGGATSVLANDEDGDGDALSAVLVDGPAHGALTLAADGSFRYVHDGSETTVDGFSYQADDGVARSAVVTVSIAITAQDDAPVAVADEVRVAEGGTVSALADGATSVLANDLDAEHDALTATLVRAPSHGTLTLRADGSFAYAHDGSETTSDSFAYRADDGTTTSPEVVVAIRVTPVNDAPTISLIADQALAEDGASQPLTFTVGDDDDDAAALVVSATSSDDGVVSAHAIAFGGSGAARTLVVTPAANAFGTSVITVSVSDGEARASTHFQVRVAPVDDPPHVSPIADQALEEDVASAPIAFTVGDVETDAADIAVRVTSSDDGLVPAAGIIVAGSGAERSIQLVPAADASGAATITVSVQAGEASIETSFRVAVRAVNDAPSLVVPSHVTVTEDSSRVVTGVAVADRDAGTGDLAVTLEAGHGKVSLGTTAGLHIASGANGSRAVALTGRIDAMNAALATLAYAGDRDYAGADIVTVTIDDLGNSGVGGALSASAPIAVEVTPVDDAPSLAALADQTLTDPESRSLALEMSDADDANAKLIATVASSDETVLPADHVTFDTADGVKSLVLVSAGHAGKSTLTLTVQDPAGQRVSRSLEVTVVCGEDLDGDGICDGTDLDTDGDGIPDVDEGTGDLDGDGTPDVRDPTDDRVPPEYTDSDGDGISDPDELAAGTNPHSADTDGDGLDDKKELDDVGTDPLVADSDGDGLDDGEEVDTYDTDPNLADTDGDGLSDGAELDQYDTDPLVVDTDGDGMKDGTEVTDHTDPLVPDVDPQDMAAAGGGGCAGGGSTLPGLALPFLLAGLGLGLRRRLGRRA